MPSLSPATGSPSFCGSCVALQGRAAVLLSPGRSPRDSPALTHTHSAARGLRTPTAGPRCCSHLPGSTRGGELEITRQGGIFAPHLFTGYFKGAGDPREILRRVCSAAGHTDPPTVLALSSCPWLVTGGQCPDSVLACRTLGAPGFGVSTSLSSLLIKLQLCSPRRLGGCQGENTKLQDALSFASSKGILHHSLCPPLQTLSN